MTHENDKLRLFSRAERCADAAGKERKMLLEKLARTIACKHCENPSKLYELQINADEQAREILRLNHVLDEVKKERDAARQAADEQQLLCEDAIESLAVISEKNCDNCGKKCRVKPKPGELSRYNCHLWVSKEPEHDD